MGINFDLTDSILWYHCLHMNEPSPFQRKYLKKKMFLEMLHVIFDTQNPT